MAGTYWIFQKKKEISPLADLKICNGGGRMHTTSQITL